MSSGNQLNLWQGKQPNCPFTSLLDEDDSHCLRDPLRQGYDTISCDNPLLPRWLASIRGVGFLDVVARPLFPISLSSNYIPMIGRDGKNLFQQVEIPVAAISLNKLISPIDLQLPTDVRKKFGIPKKTKIILLNYAKDGTIERMWPKRKEIFKRIADLKFDLVTGVDYSIWHDQEHAEHLINMKRNLLTFEEFQMLGVPTIPHMYWYGHRDLERWAEWINHNEHVTMVAINLQTIRMPLWNQVISEIKQFIPLLHRRIQFVITGPSSETKVAQLRAATSITLINGIAAHKATSHMRVNMNGRYAYTNSCPISGIFSHNIKYQEQILRTATAKNSSFVI